MSDRRKITLGQSAGQSEKPGWSIPYPTFSIPALAFLLALGVGYWLWGGVDAELSVESLPEKPTFEMEGPKTYDGVFPQPITVMNLLSRIGIPEDVRKDLLSKPELINGREIEDGRIFRIEYGSGAERPIRTFTYEHDDSTLYKLRFLPYPGLEVVERKITEHLVGRTGVITKNFWLAILDNDSMHHSLIPQVEEALKWTVDLFHLKAGDRYKMIYTEQHRDGQVIGVSRLDAVRIETQEQAYTIFGHIVGDTTVYLDSQGGGVKREFLRAPVKFAIISSPFSKTREHPVTGVNKPHGGTDFAAPKGAPILAIGDGEIVRRSKGEFNGYFVEIQHDGTFSTMYLHMDDFAPGVAPGKRVKQGQVIGYVGSTGQSTGPHVCLRFREHGKEVNFEDHRGDRILGGVAIPLSGFSQRKDSLLERLQLLAFDGLLF